MVGEVLDLLLGPLALGDVADHELDRGRSWYMSGMAATSTSTGPPSRRTIFCSSSGMGERFSLKAAFALAHDVLGLGWTRSITRRPTRSSGELGPEGRMAALFTGHQVAVAVDADGVRRLLHDLPVALLAVAQRVFGCACAR